jgi:hypothetical protein
MQDAAPCCARCSHYHDRWIGKGGLTARPPRSPDFYKFVLVGPLKPLCVQLLLTMKRHFTIALWMPVRPSATTPASLNGCGGPRWDVSRGAINLMEDILNTYYKCTLSAITFRLNVSDTRWYWYFQSNFLILKNESRLMTLSCSLCVCVSPHQFLMAERMFMKLGMYIVVPESISTAYFINPSHQSVSILVYVTPYHC